MNDLALTNVSKIVAQNFKTAQVFTAYGIDFCCNGGISLEEACQKQNLSLEVVAQALSAALAEPEEENYAGMPLDLLCDHIVSVHHSYVRNTTPALTTYLNKLCRVHGARHPELYEVRDLMRESVKELESHMQKEENILFPYIKYLVSAVKPEFDFSPPVFGHLQHPIAMMEAEHEAEGDRFKVIARLTNGFQPPQDACQTYRVAYMVLNEFESDLHKHIHLENNILFPNALSMYETISSSLK